MRKITLFAIVVLLFCSFVIYTQCQDDFWESVTYLDEPEPQNKEQTNDEQSTTIEQTKPQPSKPSDEDDFAEFNDDDEGFFSEITEKNTKGKLLLVFMLVNLD